MMSPSEFLGVHVNVLIDEVAAAKLGGLMKCSEGRLQKGGGGGGGGGSGDTPIGRKVKDERKWRKEEGRADLQTACAPAQAMCTQRKAPWCFPRTIIPLSDTSGIRNDSESTFS